MGNGGVRRSRLHYDLEAAKRRWKEAGYTLNAMAFMKRRRALYLVMYLLVLQTKYSNPPSCEQYPIGCSSGIQQ